MFVLRRLSSALPTLFAVSLLVFLFVDLIPGDPAQILAGPTASNEEIESIRTLVESELAYDPVPLIKEGDMVRVAHGPLKGVVGRLVRKGAHARLVLSVDLIGQAVSVEVDAADVKPY